METSEAIILYTIRVGDILVTAETEGQTGKGGSQSTLQSSHMAEGSSETGQRAGTPLADGQLNARHDHRQIVHMTLHKQYPLCHLQTTFQSGPLQSLKKQKIKK